LTFEGAVVVRSRRSGAVAAASIALVLASLVAGLLGSDFAMVGMYAMWPLAASLGLHLGWTRATRRPARLEVAGRRVLANGAPLFRTDVAHARIIPQPPGQGAIVQLRRRFDVYPARVALGTDEDARNFVRALGLDPREGTTRFREPLSTAAAFAIVALATVAAGLLVGMLGLPMGLLAVAAFAYGLVRLFTKTVTIGQDGILIEGLGRKRFLPYAEITSLEREVRANRRGPMVSRGFWIALDSGKRVFVDTMHERLRDGMFAGDHLFETAETALAFANRAQPRAADVLARGGRPTREWLRQLETARDVRYRVAPISDDELAHVLANPSADKTARVGAAICLARAGEEARARVRVAVEDIAAPEVRSAALAALEEDEDALAAAIDALDR
jgi:hypothetical protein